MGQREAVAAAVAAALNAAPGGTFNQAITAVMRYVPAVSLADLASFNGAVVTVVPIGPEKRTAYSRAATRKDFSVDVAIQKKVTDLTTLDDGTTNPASIANSADVSAAMQLTEQIAAFLEPFSPTAPAVALGNTNAMWTGSEVPVVYDLDHLLTQHVFTSLLVVTYAYR